MMPPPDYELLDFGAGRKLERFGEVVLDRPAPAADGFEPANRKLWRTATARFVRSGEQGEWKPSDSLPEAWQIEFEIRRADAALRFELRPSPFGHVGVFPEQFANWQWIAEQVRRGAEPPRVLNLFAYTGGSTLAAAAAGAQVVHVDAARNMVERARRNAELSGLGEHPIRWIVEDVLKFCRRELKRGNRYDTVMLDPPTYGHGPKGKVWKIGSDLPVLLELCGQLTERRPSSVLVTCHSPGIGPAELAAYVADGVFGHCGAPPQAGDLTLTTADGRRLPSGVYARWPG